MDLSGSRYDNRYCKCVLEVSDAARHAQHIALSLSLYRSDKFFGYVRNQCGTGRNTNLKASDSKCGGYGQLELFSFIGRESIKREGGVEIS